MTGVERLSRAVSRARWVKFYQKTEQLEEMAMLLEPLVDQGWSKHVEDVVEVLKALRKPTNMMILAGRKGAEAATDKPFDLECQIWQHMIDHLLQESEEQ